MTPPAQDFLTRLEEEIADSDFLSHASKVKSGRCCQILLTQSPCWLCFCRRLSPFKSSFFCPTPHPVFTFISAFGISVFFCFSALGSLLQPWSAPGANVSSLRGCTEMRSDLIRSHGWFRALNGEQQWSCGHWGNITTASALIHKGALKKAVYLNIHIQSNSSQILLVLLISYFTTEPYGELSWWLWISVMRILHLGTDVSLSFKRASCICLHWTLVLIQVGDEVFSG